MECDRLPDGPEQRKGVPQRWQPHLLLGRGRLIIERLFPGYGAELQAAGAVLMRLPADFLMLNAAGWVDLRAPGWEALPASRPLLELGPAPERPFLGHHPTGRRRPPYVKSRHLRMWPGLQPR